eukprot:530510-Pleurochrysis_carterae.AAC.1
MAGAFGVEERAKGLRRGDGIEEPAHANGASLAAIIDFRRIKCACCLLPAEPQKSKYAESSCILPPLAAARSGRTLTGDATDGVSKSTQPRPRDSSGGSSSSSTSTRASSC